MNLIWEESFKIHTYDADFNNKVKISSIFNYMQESATNHADHLRVGHKDLLEKDLFWVLSRVKIEISNFPNQGEEIRLETWPKGIDKLFALRDFYIYNSENKVIGRATTAWLMVDTKRMRPQRPKFFVERIPSFKNEHALLEVPGKILEAEEKIFISDKKVKYTDIDINRHMNNVKYIELIIDSFPQDIFKKSRIESMQVNFLSEAKFGDKIKVFNGNRGYKNSKDSFYLEGINARTSNRVFKSSVEWTSSIP